MIELQEVIDKQSREQSQMKERLAALSAHVTELEEDLDTARKDLIKSEEVNTKLQRDVREVSDSGRLCCPEGDVGPLLLWRSQPRDGCVSESRAPLRPRPAASPPLHCGSGAERPGPGGLWAVRQHEGGPWTCCILGVDSAFLQVLGAQCVPF